MFLAGASTDRMIGSVIQHYKIGDRLGAGGMGEVYLARGAGGALRAFKVVRADRSTPVAAARFRREVLALGRLQHPNIVQIFDAGRLPASSFPAPGGAVCSWIAIVFLLFVTGLIAYDGDSRVCLYVMAGWAAALGIGWLVLKNRDPQIGERNERTSLEKVS